MMHFFTYQWQRKCLAFLTAIIVWYLVNNSIISQKTIKFVPIRVVNLPNDKTIQGLLSNGFLSKRVTLTLKGTKEVIDKLEPGDLEVILDVSNLPNESIVQLFKKNLVSLNPNINLANHITSVHHPEFLVRMSPMITDHVPVSIRPPLGDPPKGYEFLDIWPSSLVQLVSGPQEQVLNLRSKGIEIAFNLDEIRQEQLDELESEQGVHDNEISYYVPAQWKKIELPNLSSLPEMLNDADAQYLHINFLRNEYLPLKNDIPVHIFYPIKYTDKVNPKSHPLASNGYVEINNYVPVLQIPLFIRNVSKLFLEIIKNNIELNIVAAPKEERKKLEWQIGFTDSSHLEDTYVAYLLNHVKTSGSAASKMDELEEHFRKRFQNYMQKMTLYVSPGIPLKLDCTLQEDHIVVKIADGD